MKTSEALHLIIKIENLFDTSSIKWDGLITWPLVRKILWFRLISINISSKNNQEKKFKNIFSITKSFVSSFFRKTKVNQDSEKIFFSRPQYLQEIKSKKYIDRIVDPIIQLCEIKKTSKYYFRKISKEKKMVNNFYVMLDGSSLTYISIKENQINILNKIAEILEIDSLQLQREYKQELHAFLYWFKSAKKLLLKHKNLKEIYLTCWYMTETMGICAAASQLGIKTIDIQHGKQGRYQAMYSGWSKIPEKGYDLMPDRFWCWGKSSCDHILSHSPNRKHHIPFVGGFPWIEYYKKNIMIRYPKGSSNIRVLVTLQPPQGDNHERIPDFILRSLTLEQIKNVHFIFRLHPNDTHGIDYCSERLKLIPSNIYTIDFGKTNLYDLFNEVTHHITAYSSCCYEASHFGLSTLLYGSESKEIYEHEIKEKIFSWTDSSTSDLIGWLTSKPSNRSKMLNPYIEDIKVKMRRL